MIDIKDAAAMYTKTQVEYVSPIDVINRAHEVLTKLLTTAKRLFEDKDSANANILCCKAIEIISLLEDDLSPSAKQEDNFIYKLCKFYAALIREINSVFSSDSKTESIDSILYDINLVQQKMNDITRYTKIDYTTTHINSDIAFRC